MKPQKQAKTCTRCRTNKNLSDFHKKAKSPDGHQPYCKTCLNEYMRDRYAAKSVAVKRSLHPYKENWADGGRRCTRCQEWKTWDCFGRSKNGYNGHLARCKFCVNQRQRSGYAKAPDVRRIAQRDGSAMRGDKLMARYGIDRAEYERMARAQRGQCAICESDAKRLVVDHCHATGNVRALLCDRCNRALHSIEEEGLLPKLIRYVEHHKNLETSA